MIKPSKLSVALLCVLAGLMQTNAAAESNWHDRRFRNMLPQELDMSCGAASIASLARFYGGVDVGEANVLEVLSTVVPKDQEAGVIENGFSLLHLKQAMARFGLELRAATTFNAQLAKFNSPAMLQLKTRQGFHFVIWHGKYKGLHWVGDPSRGDMWLSDLELEQEWTGIAAWLFKEGKPLQAPTPQQMAVAYHHR